MARTVTKNKQINQYRETLLEKGRELRSKISSLAASEIVVRREEPNDMVDLAGQSHEEWIFLNRNAQNMALLRQVNEALERMDEGTYSVCAECDQPISPKRLAAVPWAKYCIACQEKHGSWTN